MLLRVQLLFLHHIDRHLITSHLLLVSGLFVCFWLRRASAPSLLLILIGLVTDKGIKLVGCASSIK